MAQAFQELRQLVKTEFFCLWSNELCTPRRPRSVLHNLTLYTWQVERDPDNRAAIAAARRCKEKLESSVSADRSPVAAAVAKLKDPTTDAPARAQAMKAIMALAHDDESTAAAAGRLGVLPLLWGLLEEELAVKALSVLTRHRVVADAANAARLGGEEGWDSLVAAVSGSPGRAKVAVSLAVNLLTRGTRPETPGLEDAEGLASPAALAVWSAAVAHEDSEVRALGLDAVVQWCSEAPSWATGGDDPQATMAQRRTKTEAERRWKKVLGRRASELCKSPVNQAMFNLLDSEAALERQMALAAFGRVLGTVGDETELKSLLGPVVAPGQSPDLTRLRRKAALTSALFLADADTGVWVLASDGAIKECLALIASGDEMGQALAAETLCLAASNESGRSLLGPVVEAGTLDSLLDSPNARARSAAASTMAKLGVASKALSSGSSDTGRLLNTAMLLLKGAEEASGEQQSAAQAKFAESSDQTTERAVEVLAALITKSEVKDELAHGSGRCAQALPRLVALAKDGRGAAAYGLAHIFASLSVTNKEVQERALAEREMEITPEQLAELQRITKQKGEAEEDTDNSERCGWRIRMIVQADGIRALVRLTEGASEKTKEQIALALRQLSVEPAVRGSLVQQGGFKACINFSAAATRCSPDACTWQPSLFHP